MTFVTLVEMAALLISGIAGATLAVTLSSFGILEDVLADQLPVANMGSATRALLGFVGGVMIWYALSFLRIRVIRLLLSYDHWFIGKPNFVDYVSDIFLTRIPVFCSLIQLWAMCLKLLMNSKNLGIRGYQDMLPTLPVPPLKTTCAK